MKKGQVCEGIIEKVDFPNKGAVITADGERATVKNGIPGQKISFTINKVRKGKCEGRLLEVLEKSADEMDTPACVHFGTCGGCTYQSLPYEKQLELKSGQVQELMDAVIPAGTYDFLGIKGSPKQFDYRNKMEYSFGDEFLNGPLSLGMHKKGSFHDIVTVSDCKIVSEDYNQILSCVKDFFGKREVPFYHKMRHTGYLRHLLVRRGEKTGEILIDLVTTTQSYVRPQQESKVEGMTLSHENPLENNIVQETVAEPMVEHIPAIAPEASEEELLNSLVTELLGLNLGGTITGILHTKNDSIADIVKNEGTDILYGQDYFFEELLGLKFKISTFSFFQTNSLGAEVLYETAREFIGDSITGDGSVVFDLYSGTGTIAQMLAPVAKKVIGVEIIEEAVEAAKENAQLNHLTNCEFIAGDVLKVIDTIEERPDFIVLDPPRDGIHPKALEKIIKYNVDRMVYISCKPTSLQRDLEVLQARGYKVEKVCCVDMFPGTVHVETVVALHRTNS